MGMVRERERKYSSRLNTGVLFFHRRNIPVDFKYIADPTMHSMPAVAQSRNGWLNPEFQISYVIAFEF
jgi:pre-mRNA-processing factor 17